MKNLVLTCSMIVGKTMQDASNDFKRAHMASSTLSLRASSVKITIYVKKIFRL